MSRTRTSSSLGMMAKYWIPGQVKTRLAQDCSNQIAANIHQCFTLYLVQSLADQGEQRLLFTSPDDRVGDMRLAVEASWEVRPQGDGDLGCRMQRAFQEMLKSPSQCKRSAILIGADLPTITPDDLRAAFEALQTHDIVLGPAVDGGYYLIGLQGPWRVAYESLFHAMPWSTELLMQETLRVIAREGLRVRLLAIREDIDTLASLDRLREMAIAPKLGAALRRLLSDSPL